MARPTKDLDWDQVDHMLAAGCHGTEIASYFDMHPMTFYNKVQETHNVGFTEYCALKNPKGDALLRLKQFDGALEGDTSLLIFLGKARLKQRETHEMHVSPETIKSFCSVMSNLRSFQEGRAAPQDQKSEEPKITPFKTHFPSDEI